MQTKYYYFNEQQKIYIVICLAWDLEYDNDDIPSSIDGEIVPQEKESDPSSINNVMDHLFSSCSKVECIFKKFSVDIEYY